MTKTPVKVGHIAKKVINHKFETILHIVLKSQFDSARFPGRKASANFGGKVEHEEKKY